MCRGRELGLGWRTSLGVTGAFTATGVANRGIRRHSAAPGEYEPGFLNGLRRSVNRKVQGSSPCPGANSHWVYALEVVVSGPMIPTCCWPLASPRDDPARTRTLELASDVAVRRRVAQWA